MRPRRNWSHPIFDWAAKARDIERWIGSRGGVQTGQMIGCREIHRWIQSQRSWAKILGVCCRWRCNRNVWRALFLARVRSSLQHHRKWVVSSHSSPHTKHQSSWVLLNVWRCRAVGSKSFMYLESWVRCPVEYLLAENFMKWFPCNRVKDVVIPGRLAASALNRLVDQIFLHCRGVCSCTEIGREILSDGIWTTMQSSPSAWDPCWE
jgi:hypothetical protein